MDESVGEYLKPYNCIQLKEHGDYLYRLSNYNEAADCYGNAIKTAKLDEIDFLVKCYSNRTAAYMAGCRYELALLDIDKCEELDKNFQKGPYRRLQCYTRMGKMLKARNLINARENAPPDNFWDKAIAEHNETINSLDEIKNLMNKEDYRTALYYAGQLYNKGFRGTQCYLAKAESLMELERFTEAEQEVNLIFAKDQLTKNPDALYIRGKCLYFLRPDDLKTTHDVLRCALVCDPDHRKAKNLSKTVAAILDGKTQAEKATTNKLFKEAFELYKSFFHIALPNKKLYYKLIINQSLAAFKAGMFYSGIDCCTTVLKHDPENVQALRCRAECYEKVQSWAKCMKDVEDLLGKERSQENMTYYWKIKSILIQEGKTSFQVNSSYLEACQTLGVSAHANQKEIKNAYKRLSFKYHPDKNLDQPPEKLAENAKLLHKVGEAYKLLLSKS